MESPRLQRAVVPARINASTKLFAFAVLFASLAAGATVGMIQPQWIDARMPRAMPAPDWKWIGGKVTYIDVAHNFTLSTHVRATSSSSYVPIMSNGEWMLGTRDGSFEVMVFEQSGETIRLRNSTPIAHDKWMHVAITRYGSQFSLWVDGNETRMRHDAPTLEDERLAIAHRWKRSLADVTIWNRALGAAQIARLQ